MTDVLPKKLGRYRLISAIGSGAIGTVFLAHDPLIDRRVAIKVIRIDALAEAERIEYLERFRIEARAGGRCLHPAIVAIHDAGEDDGRPYLVMEFIEGVSLQQAMADPVQSARSDPVLITTDLLDALQFAHGQGIIHRDVKPANIMLPSSGGAKVADFGIAKLDLGQATAVGDMLGTPSYMAPEQARGETVDHRADLFSAACVLHAMLTGRAPFVGRNVTDTLFRLTGPEEADLAAVAAGPHAALVPVLRRGLAKDREARFASAAAFSAAIADATPAAEDATRVFRRVRTEEARAGLSPVMIEAAANRLAQYIGPIAWRTARLAAERIRTAADFHAELAKAIATPAEAARFLREVGAGGAPLPVPSATVSTQKALELAATRGISPAALEATRAALAAHVGPVARVLVDRALLSTTTLEDLVATLASSIPDPRAAEKFRQTVRAALERFE